MGIRFSFYWAGPLPLPASPWAPRAPSRFLRLSGHPRSYNWDKSPPNAETKGAGASRDLLRAHMQRI